MENKLTIRLSDYTQAHENASSSRISPLIFMFQKIDFTIVFLLKKYPEILDKPFLRLYLCIVIRKTTQPHFSIFNSQFLIQEKHGKKRNLFRIPSYQPS